MLSQPLVLAENIGGEAAVRLRLRVPSTLMQFEGHFPGSPILAGVTQVDWAVQLARARLPVSGCFTALAGLKFMHVIGPDAEVDLELQWTEGTLTFRYSRAERICSQGRVLFRA